MVYALITVYGFEDNAETNIRKISAQADKVIVCDNSREKSNRELPENVEYVFNEGNLGISVAYNKVLKDERRNWKDSDFVIFFDQDTVVPINHIEYLVNEYQLLTKKGKKIGAIGPVFYNTNSKREESTAEKRISDHSWSAKGLITSSMLIRYDVLKYVGFWNEELFLDLCDWDLIWRITKLGYICAETDVSIIQHTLGESEKKLGPITAKESVPIREYYQTRDCLKLLHMPYTPTKYKLRFIAQITIRPILHLLLLPNRKERARYIREGIRDYKKGINGEYSVNAGDNK